MVVIKDSSFGNRGEQLNSQNPIKKPRKTTHLIIPKSQYDKYHSFIHFEEESVLATGPDEIEQFREQAKNNFEKERQKLRWTFNEGINYKEYLKEKITAMAEELDGDTARAQVIAQIAVKALHQDMKEIITNTMTGKIQPSKEIMDDYILQAFKKLRYMDKDLLLSYNNKDFKRNPTSKL